MKKLVLASLLLAASFNSFSQTQIPNGDFENWKTFPHCKGIDSLENFLTYDILVYYLGVLKLKSGYCTETPTPIKSTDKQSGSYALLIKALNVEGTIGANFVMLGPVQEIESNIGTYGIPFTGRPTKLTGYYKFTKGGSDILEIDVYGSVPTSEDPVFYGEYSATTTQATYKKFEIPLIYDPLNSSNPTMLQVAFSVSNAKGSADAQTVALIDNLVFEYGTTSTSPFTEVSPVTIYTTQKDIHFSEQVTDITICSMVGSQELNQSTSTKTLNGASLKNGLYIVTYKYNDTFYSKKVVIE